MDVFWSGDGRSWEADPERVDPSRRDARSAARCTQTTGCHTCPVEIAAQGKWRYDASVEQPVDIVGLTFDYWYELAVADESLEPGEAPTPLGPNGMLYYVRFRRAGDLTTPTWVDSAGYATVAEAKSSAEASAPTTIGWQ